MVYNLGDMKKAIAIIILGLLFGSSAYAEEKKLKFRGAAATDSSPTNVVINIHPEMLVLDEFKKINKNYNSLKAYAKKIDKLTKSREKINFLETKAKLNLRASTAKNIYSQFADSVVLIGNYETEMFGAGFLVNKVGLILTNWHVTNKAERVGVWTKPKKGLMSLKTLLTEVDPYVGTVVAENVEIDLALVRVHGLPKNMKVVPFASSSDISIGDKVYAIGHPVGYPWTFTEGIINQIREDMEWTYEDKSKHKATVIQTQTPISPGNSGGPLFSSSARLLGVNSLGDETGQNINFAVIIKHVREFIEANPNLAKMNPAEPAMKKDYPNAKTEDYNKNGVIDTWYIDENKNGKIDTALLDDNEDGIIEAILLDENENGVWEIQIIDDDLNGKPDRAFIDENEDKKPDVIAYDIDQDGTWDKYEKIS